MGLFFVMPKSVFMKKIVNTPEAPMPIGPYNQATVFNGMVFASGQIALHPQSGQLVLDDIETETHQVLRNLRAVLEAAGSNLDQLKTSIFSAVSMPSTANILKPNTHPPASWFRLPNCPASSISKFLPSRRYKVLVF
jgi:enamine deaminase RidA (YjgF/YER057c/UK114 family)